MSRVKSRFVDLVGSTRFPLIAAGIAVFLTLPSLWMGFFADDFMQRAVFLQPPGLEGMFGDPFKNMFTFADGDPERMDIFIEKGIYPWYTLPTIKISMGRPLTVATHWLDYELWPDSPVMMHVHNLLWFAILVVAVGLYYRRMFGGGLVAGLAVLLFAIDDAHAWPAAWIANRNALIAMPLGILVLTMHDRWRRESSGGAAVVGIVVLALALLAKESALSVVGYIVAYALFVDTAALRDRVLSTVPYVLVVGVWRVWYTMAGFGSVETGSYYDPLASPIAFTKVMFFRIPILLLGQWGFPPSDIASLGPPQAKWMLFALSIPFLFVLSYVILPLLKRDKLARFWFTGMILSLVPVSSAGPQDRLLMFAGLGGAGLLAQLLIGLRDKSLIDPAKTISRRVARPMYVVLIGVHCVLAPILLPGTLFGLTALSNIMMEPIRTGFPSDSEVTDKTLVLLNGSNYPVGTYLYIVRGLSGVNTPARLRSLAPASMVVVPITITRMDEYTLLARPKGGYETSLFRGADNNFAVGDVVELSDVLIEVTELSEQGWASEVRYQFNKPLEDPSFIWFLVDGTDFVPATLPEIGETITLLPFGSEV